MKIIINCNPTIFKKNKSWNNLNLTSEMWIFDYFHNCKLSGFNIILNDGNLSWQFFTSIDHFVNETFNWFIKKIIIDCSAHCRLPEGRTALNTDGTVMTCNQAVRKGALMWYLYVFFSCVHVCYSFFIFSLKHLKMRISVPHRET